ncbi:flagellar hook-length control protein FliK [Desulforamulus hydrothermalis]|uniref:Flagellar hook-length control protein-like C-terminal domain-containing protein n=1 Tax=Desulforamulus hydrothermalis Lam5 = DSM 18033 TaxID=1121428 RepID=K8E0N0_9FIRM|nr:flagellar hook-length control protein FliK [Desulforamulus hydrothermalis]CCO09169.1 hypothetical hypothetical protein [Desulforamulus hydrothermalis Lam5 = DSM 18033]SHH11366.1 hook-length control protein FliK [Desulforamulus hydrothermalis Lam5 = DSM 18033]
MEIGKETGKVWPGIPFSLPGEKSNEQGEGFGELLLALLLNAQPAPAVREEQALAEETAGAASVKSGLWDGDQGAVISGQARPGAGVIRQSAENMVSFTEPDMPVLQYKADFAPVFAQTFAQTEGHLPPDKHEQSQIYMQAAAFFKDNGATEAVPAINSSGFEELSSINQPELTGHRLLDTAQSVIHHNLAPAQGFVQQKPLAGRYGQADGSVVDTGGAAQKQAATVEHNGLTAAKQQPMPEKTQFYQPPQAVVGNGLQDNKNENRPTAAPVLTDAAGRVNLAANGEANKLVSVANVLNREKSHQTLASNHMPLIAGTEENLRHERPVLEGPLTGQAKLDQPLTLVSQPDSFAINANQAEQTGQQVKPVPQQEVTASQLPAKISEMIRSLTLQHNPEHTVLRIKLQPAHLGEVQVKLTWSKGELSAQFIASTVTAKDAIEAAFPQLKEILAQQDIRLSEAAVFLGQSNSQSNQQRSPHWEKTAVLRNKVSGAYFAEPLADANAPATGTGAIAMAGLDLTV